jgi:hypothetical protein
MNRTVESLLRFVNLTSSGLLAGSLGFGQSPLVPGWQQELPRKTMAARFQPVKSIPYYNAIGPVALGSAVTLAVAGRGLHPVRRLLDAAAAVGLAGVLAATIMVTVPANKRLEEQAATDYPSDESHSLVRNWSVAHKFRTSLGIASFVFAVVSNLAPAHGAKR